MRFDALFTCGTQSCHLQAWRTTYNNAIKLMSVLRHTSSINQYNYLANTTIHASHEHDTGSAFRYLNDPDEQNSNNFFRYNSNMYNYNTRGVQNNNLHIAQKHPKSFIHLGSTAWNDVPPTIRSANNIANYKRLYKKHHFENLNN